MAKHKHAKKAAAAKSEAPVVETVKTEAAQPEVAARLAEAAPVAEPVKAEAPVVEAVAAAAETLKEEAVRAEAAVNEAAGQVSSFVKERLEQAQRQLGQLEAEAQKAFESFVSRGRESGREVLQRLQANEARWRESPAGQKLAQQALWVGGAMRERLVGLQGRMVKVVGNVASPSQAEALNQGLERLTRKLDALVAPLKPAPRQDTPEA
ncbi:hypothetical protein P2318_28330 [Myxococcaceae bacterium GXIMD 01537]